MNRFHKIVWSVSRQQYIVASELAQGNAGASATSGRDARSASRALRHGMLVAALAAGIAGPALALASSCKTDTSQHSAPAGGLCAIADYNPPVSQDGAGGAVVNHGQTVTLTGTSVVGTGYSGNTTVPADSVNVVSGTFGSSALVTGPQNATVSATNPATGATVVYRTYDSAAFADQSNLATPVNQFENVSGDMYYHASLGRVDQTGGTLNVNLGATPSGAPSSNSLLMVSKQTYLTAADGSGNAASRVVWRSRNAIDMGIDPGLPTPDVDTGLLTVQVPVTTYAGTVTFNGITYTVTNAAQLAAYNDVLVAALHDGILTSQQAYDAAFAQAYTTVDTPVTYATKTTAGDLARAPNGDRYAILATGRNGSAVIAAGGQIDITRASGALKVTNGALGINHGTLSGNVIEQLVRVDNGGRFINAADGVVSSGYVAGDKLDTATANTFYYTGSGIIASGQGSSVQNSGVINVSGFAYAGNTSVGMGLAQGASGSNDGNINVGVNPGYVTTVVGVNVSGGSSFVNDAAGTLYIGRAAQYGLADAAADVAISGPTYGVRIMDTGDSAINNGNIVIGTQAQGAVGMFSTAPIRSLLLNNGTIEVTGQAAGTPLANIGMMADDNGAAGTGAVVRNAGTINLTGVNGVGLMVNADPGIAANAESTGTINVAGGADIASGTRNFGVWVNGAQGVAQVSGAVNLAGTGAIGVFAQNGGTINVDAGAVPQFLAGTDQIGFYAAGAGSSINVNASVLSVATDGSSLFRVADGAAFTGASTAGALDITVAGKDARGVVATGMGTTLSTGASTYRVTGAAGGAGGSAAVVTEGGAMGTIDAGTTIVLANAGATAGIVDGQAHDLTGAAIGWPVATVLTNNAAIQSDNAGAVGFIARNLGTLNNNADITLTGPGSTGVVVGPRGTVNNTATIRVANGDGALVQGAQASLVNNGTIRADDGVAAVHLTGAGASVAFSGAGRVEAGGTADGILIDATATDGRVTGTAGAIVIDGTGMALDNRAAGGSIALTNTSIRTTGSGAAGISSSGANGEIMLSGGTLDTVGDHAVGIYVSSAGRLAMTDTTITTLGAGAHGILLDNGATATLSGGSVATQGTGAAALYVEGPQGAATVTGTTLSSTAGAGAQSNAGGTLALRNAALAGATAGLAVTDTQANGQASTITVTGGSLAATAGNAIEVTGARANITLAGEVNVRAASGTLLNLTNASTVNLSTQGVRLNGDLIADASSGGVVSLNQGSVLTGRIDPLDVNIDATSTWNVTASSVTGALSNAGTVAFLPPTGDPRQAGSYKTLTASSYVGANGTVALNTWLGGDGSPSDRLVVSGGAATGATALRIVNTGGPGVLTTGDGINVVAVTGGGSTAPGAFRLASPVQAGAYEYLLYRGGSNSADDYYLRSALVDPVTSGGGPGKVGGSAGGGAAPIAYRPGVVGYTLLPAMNMDYGFTNLGRLHERVGDVYNTEQNQAEQNQPGKRNGVWGRMGGYGVQGDSGSRFSANQSTFFMQFGKDWTLKQDPEGGSTHAGVTASLSVTDSKFKDGARDLSPMLSDTTGKATTQAQSVGGYYTKYLRDGSYWDSVAQVTHYNNKYNDTYGNGASQHGFGIALSQEVGKPFLLMPKLAIEPQAQLVYQYLDLDHFNDGISSISGTSSNAVRGRLGVRIYAPNVRTEDGTGAGTPYMTIDVLHDFVPIKAVSVDGTSLRPTFSRTWGELGFGLNQSIGKGSQLYAAIKFTKNLDGESRKGVFGQVGYRYSW
ncbi:autotransporter outer membrane beta-barrel domain-containing protein [Achromobacter aloeverae]|uniref:Autotransporter outer membrane beta-barrel domain-containing protein n=1 Tax=Achromobacter aloeverae TaxID=1750518 RepID=A0A4Q1HMP9_9BURK|nr:autotransporter outer membrane beta-barrel domain-containing protein [Achromobacter aloeverae]RXN92254.1 autotransporter outer membrane beta-barrel domain-containing protein [Achromobacter aloeverae]